MGAKPKAMEEIRSVIRLNKEGFSNYAINEHTGISLPTIRKYLNRLKQVDLSAEELLALDDHVLDAIAPAQILADRSENDVGLLLGVVEQTDDLARKVHRTRRALQLRSAPAAGGIDEW